LLQIMVVDDNGADARLIGEILKDAGLEHELVWIDNGGEALDRIRSEEGFDLFIIDLNLPKSSGLDIVAVLRGVERYRKTPVIMMTGSIPSTEGTAMEGMDDLHLLVKPMTADEMDRTALKIRGVVSAGVR
jgi:CheY-like chemotaxis protein